MKFSKINWIFTSSPFSLKIFKGTQLKPLFFGQSSGRITGQWKMNWKRKKNPFQLRPAINEPFHLANQFKQGKYACVCVEVK